MAVKKFLLLTLPAIVITLAGVEGWVRLSWDQRRGTPALFISDPMLVQRFAPNYTGWFAGVPIHINNLGLHDTRDYSLDKSDRTFRILLLGDSVAFGHGSLYEHTYAYLLEQRLKSWRPDVDWQIWNAGVPGYNSSQELAYLQKVGPIYRPDLVIVGFHPNDINANDIVREPTRKTVALAAVRNWIKRTFYSYEFYRRLYLQLKWKLFASGGSKQLLENLGAEDELLADMGRVQNLPQQQINQIEPLSDDALATVHCRSGRAIDEVKRFQTEPEAERWRHAIQGFQDLHRRGVYRIMFFVSTAPEICPEDDLFFDGGSRAWNDFFLRELSQDTPAISTYDAVLHYRPSQMPQAKAHALGNVNRVKADLLFAFLRDHMLPETDRRVRQ
jgi:hypothetical protein